MADATLPTSERLKNGAKLLGVLWRSGHRCGAGWSCGCCQKPTKFCMAKGQWLMLAVVEGRALPDSDSPFALVEMMTFPEFDATGMTITVELAGFGTYKVGPKGSIKLGDLASLSKAPEAAVGVFKLLNGFPGSVVVGIEEPKKEEVKTS